MRLDEHLESEESSDAAYERQLDVLEQAGLVDYDESRRTVSRGPNFEQVAPLVRALSEASECERERDKLELINRSLRHDLLNSLNTVRGRVAALEEDGTGDPSHDHHDVIERRVEELITRVKTIGAFTDAIVSDGTHELGDRPLRETLDEEVSRLERLHEHVDVQQNDVPDVDVRADDRLPLVFENLLRNAVEHSDRESPSVRVTGRCDGEDVEVVVADDGPGISDSKKAEIFEDGVMGTESDGRGFGLHFVKWTVDDYGGDVAIDDRESRGTAVTIRLRRSPG
ncbi:sensor histidine kinase [Haloplanus sp. GCM10025708]|uniref:sensor histidine kinase n=1 Tax=Haloferacaceae TaxID=1644056 RepID=UPI0036107C1D